MTALEPASIYQHRVKDLMSRDVVTVEAGDTIHEALTVMGENRVSAMPVIDNHNRCIGILSSADLIDMTRDLDADVAMLDTADPSSLRFLLQKLVHTSAQESVQSFMSESVTTISPEASIAIATREMLRNQIHHLPVVNQQGRLVGFVSSMDILAEFADGAPDS